METKKLSTKELSLISIVTAMTCILGPIVFPLPFSPIPISLLNLMLYISAYLLGTKKASFSYLLYYFIGFIGLPVFSGFSGGLGKILGPTGGYLVGFILIVLIGGKTVERFPNNCTIQALGFAAATCLCYLFAAYWLSIQSHTSFLQALIVGVIPFLPGDIVKIIVAVAIGPVIKRYTSNFVPMQT